MRGAITVKSGATLYLDDDTTLCGDTGIESLNIADGGRFVATKARLEFGGYTSYTSASYRTSIQVQKGGTMELTDTHILGTLDDQYCTFTVESGGTLTMSGCTTENLKELDVNGTLTMNNSTVDAQLDLAAGASLSGEGNTLTGDNAVIYLEAASIDISKFKAKATGKSTYIYVYGGNVSTDTHYAKLGEGLSLYHMGGAITVKSEATLYLDDDTTLCGDTGIESLNIADGGRFVATKARLEFGGYTSYTSASYRTSIQVQKGGTMELTDTHILGTLDDQYCTFTVESGGTLTMSGCTTENLKELDVNGTLTMNNSTVDAQLDLAAGASLSGEGNTLTGDNAVIYLEAPSIDVSNFRATATGNTTYISVGGGNVSSDVHYAKLGEGLELYHMRGAITVKSGATLYLDDDTTLCGDTGIESLNIADGGRFVATKARLEFGGYTSYTSASYRTSIQVQKGGTMELTDTHILGTIDDQYCTFIVESEGSLSMSGCTTEKIQELSVYGSLTLHHSSMTGVTNFRLETGSVLNANNSLLNNLIERGTLVMDDSTVEGRLTLNSGATVRGSGNIFTGSGAVIWLASPATDMSSFFASATADDAYVGINAGNIGSSIRYTKLGERLGMYLLSGNSNADDESVRVKNGGTLFLGEGATLRSTDYEHDLIIESGGRFEANGARLEFTGKQQSGERTYLSGLDVLSGGEAVLTDTVVEGYLAPGGWTMNSDYPTLYVASGGSMTMEGCTLQNVNRFLIMNNATLSMNNTKLLGLVLYNEAQISGSGNVFTGSGEVISLQEGPDVDMSNFHATATAKNAYIEVEPGQITHIVHYTKLGEGLDTYLIQADDTYDEPDIRVKSGAALCIGEGVTLRSTEGKHGVVVESGATFEANGARLEFPGNSANAGSGTLTLQRGSTATITQCSGSGRLNIASGSTVSIHGNDFSQMTVNISSVQTGDAPIDLSGNYWGVSSKEEILAKISGSKSNVVINDWLLVDPTTEFIFLDTSLHNQCLAKGVTSFSINFTHEVDASTVSHENIRLLDERGNEVELTEISVEGKQIRISFAPLNREGEYRLVVGEGICDIVGSALVPTTENPYATLLKADFVAPRVSHLEPGGDFVGTLSKLKIYFTDAVDTTTLKAGITILNPAGQKVEITKVRDLGGNAYALEFAAQTVHGAYTVTVGTGVMDMAGNRLNQNGNDVPGEAEGDSFVGGFAIADVDLTITDVQVAPSLTSGEAVTVTWSGENATGYALMGSWTDGVYLSRDGVWDINDALLGSYAHSGGLAEGESYEGSLSFSLPGVTAGDYYLLVRSDMYGQEQADKESPAWAQNLKAVAITVSVPELTLGQTQQGQMVKTDHQDVYRLHQESDQSLKLSLSSSETTANMEIFIGYGRVPTRESYDLALQQCKGSGELIIPSRKGGGEVYVLVNNKSAGTELSYELKAEAIPMTVTSITPTTQGCDSETSFDIYGVNFTTNTRVVLVDAEGNEYTPDYLDVISSERIRIRYDAKRLPIDKLDVIVRSETEQVSLADAITITASEGAHLKIAADYPSKLGYHIASTLKLHYENTGTDPMHAPLVTVTGKQNGKEGAIMTLDSALINNGFWTNAMPEGFANSVSFLAYSPGTPGWLMPSGRDAQMELYSQELKPTSQLTEITQREALKYFANTQLVHEGDGYKISTVSDTKALTRNLGNLISSSGGGSSQQLGNTTSIYYCGWQQPWDFSYPSFNFEINYIGTDNTTPLDWNDCFSSMDMAPELSQTLASSMTASAGDTWGDYVLMLNENLIYLDEIGALESSSNTAADTDELVSFELMKVNGTLSPVKVLASSTDAAVSSPGLSLAVSRAFQSDLTSRFEQGAFGYGWSFNWDIDLSFREDGTVELNMPGAQLVYQPDYRGGYINASGDQGVFKKNKDGSYTLTEPDGMVLQFAADGKLLTETDANGNRISCTYDAETGNLTRLTHSNGSFIALTWDEAGHIIRVEDSQGDTVDYTYEGDHLISATNQHGESVQYSYSSEFAHALTRVTGTDGISTDFSYNSHGLLEDSSQSSANEEVSGYGKVTLSYGENGEVTVTDIYGATSTYYYDNKGQVRRAVDANGNTVRYGYDDKGNVIWFTDQSGNTSAYTYDEAGNMTSATNALGYTSTYTYTASNALDVLTDALGHTIDYDYDARGNMTRITYADGSSESWTYDAVGNADSWTNRRGHTIRSEYDAQGRVTARHYEDGTSATFVYDERGNLLEMSDSTGTTSYTYSEKSELLSLTRDNGQGLSFTYDSAGRRSTMTDSTGNVTHYSYTAFGLLERVEEQKAGETSRRLLVEYSYDQGGRLVHEEQGNGTNTDYHYTLTGQVERQTTRNAAGEVLQYCAYTYDEVGLRTSMETQDGTWVYSYDKIGQLTRAVFTPAADSPLAAQDCAYSYDAAGNRTSTIINGVETLYETNNLNQTTSAGDVSYTYDADGNMLSKTDANGTTLYTWDDDNQLIRVQMSTGEVYSYTYNAAGERVSVSHGGETTEYLYDPAGYGNLVAEYNAKTGEQEKTYSHGNGLIGFEEAFNGTYWYQGDALGSVTGITDGSGNLVATYSYDPYGNSLSSTGTLDNSFQWVGQWGLSTEETGLTLMRARYYDPVTGKFISADPSGVNGGNNLYAYCGNNSISFVDFSGNNPFLFKFLSLTQKRKAFLSLTARTGGQASSQATNVTNTTLASTTTKKEVITGANLDTIISIAALSLIGLGSGASKVNAATSADNSSNASDSGGLQTDSTDFISLALTMGSAVIWFMPGGFIPGLVLTAADYAWTRWGKDKFNEWMESEKPSTTLDLGDLLDNLASHDPNDLVGPTGYGEKGYVAPMESMDFMLRFENDKEATAPTRWMRMYNYFDESFDLDSFTLGSFCLAGNLIEVADGQDSFNQILTMNFNGQDMLVEVKINMNREERQLEAEFTAIDPNTGWMIQDPTVGMLYPNDASGRGDGYITYSIETRDDLANGASFSNVADIYFDFNEVIPTPELVYTIDSLKPTSTLLSAEDQGDNGEALLTWEGADADSGIGSWLIFVQKDGGEFAFWKSFDAETTSATFAGEENGLYGFYVVAADNVGNVESGKNTAEAEVTLTSTDRTAPETVSNLSALIDGSEVLCYWGTVDDPSGVFYRVEYTQGDDWAAARVQETPLSATVLPALEEGMWNWRVQAVDGLGNASAWTEGESFLVDITTPALPEPVVVVEGTRATLSWAALADASGVSYELRYKKPGDAEFTSLGLTAETAYSLSELDAGGYEWSIRAVDGAGNASAWVEGAPFLVGEGADKLRFTSAPELVKAGNGKVKAALNWEGESSARYTLVVDGKTVVKNKAVTSWKGTLADGEHRYELSCGSTTLTGGFRYDATAPALTLQEPTLVKAGEGLVSATFGWNGHEEGLVYTLIIDKDKEPTYRGTNPTPTLTLADGKHSYTLTATDAMGNVSRTVKGSFSYDATAPALSVNPYKLKVDKKSGQVTSATLSWKGEKGCRYTIEVDGEVQVSGSTKTSYTIVNDGQAHRYTITATDKSGNTTRWEDSRALSCDTTAPVLTALTHHMELANNTQGSPVTTLSWQGENESLLTYTIKVDGKTIKDASITSDGAGGYSYTHAAPLKPGTHRYEITATDWAGNKVTCKGKLYEFTTPKLSVSKPKLAKVMETVTNDKGQPINVVVAGVVDATLTWKGDTNASYTLLIDGEEVSSATITEKKGSYTYRDTLRDGAHSYRIIATGSDATGAAATYSVAEGLFTYDTTAPEILLGSLGGSVVSGKPGAADKVEAALCWAGEDGVSYSIKLGKKTVYSGKGTSHTYAFEQSGAEGHELTITAKDSSGNVSTHTATLHVGVSENGEAVLSWGNFSGVSAPTVPQGAQALAWQAADTAGIPGSWSSAESQNTGEGRYSFTLEEARQLDVKLTGLGNDAEVVLSRADGTGRIALAAYAATGLDHELSLSAGTYYLQVNAGDGSSELGDYTLDLELEANGKKQSFAQATLASLA